MLEEHVVFPISSINYMFSVNYIFFMNIAYFFCNYYMFVVPSVYEVLLNICHVCTIFLFITAPASKSPLTVSHKICPYKI